MLLCFKYLLLQLSYVFRDTLSCLTKKKKKGFSFKKNQKVIYLYICKANATNTFVLYLDSALENNFLFSARQKYDR